MFRIIILLAALTFVGCAHKAHKAPEGTVLEFQQQFKKGSMNAEDR